MSEACSHERFHAHGLRNEIVADKRRWMKLIHRLSLRLLVRLSRREPSATMQPSGRSRTKIQSHSELLKNAVNMCLDRAL